ncbi:MAG: DNA starvation/stationary phase protection protein [Pseudomonadota bacterium]
MADGPTNATDTIIDALTQAVSETTVETMKAQNFHWNVKGMAFKPLHELFQEIYEDHFAAQDDLSERVKALGGHAEGRLSAMVERSKLSESDGQIASVQMIEELAADQETLSKTLGDLAQSADEIGDIVSHDLAVARQAAHDKFAWMLRAHLG